MKSYIIFFFHDLILLYTVILYSTWHFIIIQIYLFQRTLFTYLQQYFTLQ